MSIPPRITAAGSIMRQSKKVKLYLPRRKILFKFVKTNCAMEIPRGNSREDAKARKQIIGDFYSKWISKHPDKKIWNRSLGAYIHIKYQSVNETKGQASVSYESTCAVLELTEVLENALVFKRKPAKNNDKNQRPYDQMVFLYHKGIRLLVGHQKSTDEYVQYCITAKK